MKLFLTYSLEKYTNALISFKNSINAHWLAKNALLMGQDIKSAKKKLMKSEKSPPVPLEERKTEKRKRLSDPGFGEDSILSQSKVEQKNRDRSFTVQEMDKILKNVEAESPAGETKQDSLLVVPSQVLPKSPNKSLFSGEVKFGNE